MRLRANAPARTGWWLMLALVGAVLFVADLVSVEERATQALDRSVDLSVHHTFGHSWYQPFVAITTIGNTPIRTGFLVALILALVLARRWWSAAFAFSGAGGASLLALLIKLAVRRPRPHLFPHVVSATGWSFPSGHATDTCSLALVMLYINWHLWGRVGRTVVLGVTLLVIVLLIGLSRIVLGVHYPTDVIGGYVLAIAWVALVVGFLTPAFDDERTRARLRRIGVLDAR